MKYAYLMIGVALSSLLVVGEASAKGCLKGAAVGGVAGHFAGKHAIGRHRANKADREAAAAAASSKRLPPPSK
jgi:hypothetical protein